MTKRRFFQTTSSEPVQPRIAAAVPLLFCSLFFSLLLVPSSGFALDGLVELRGSHQEGRAGIEAYETDTLWQILNMGQSVNFSRQWFLRVDANARRERLWGKSQFDSASNDKKFMSPNFNLTFHDPTYRVSLHGRAIRTDQVRTGLPDQRDEHVDIGLWGTANYDWLKLDANAQEAASWRYAAGHDRENRDHQASFLARANVSEDDEVRYRFSRTKQDLVNLNSASTFITNVLQYRGKHFFDEQRGDFNIYALYNNFQQTDHVDDLVGLQYVLPVYAGYVLDDTPGNFDPLEGEPIEVPDLYDRDRDTPTEINIGDNAPPVRDYGGDFRNILLDFGDTQEINTLILYVDRLLRFPGLMNWALYVSDSADGRDWGTVLSPATYTINYVEYETGRQGWVVQFETPINHRRIKMVNSKLGPTEPDIFITEFELFQTSITTTPDRKSTTIRQRLEGDVGYYIAPQLRVRYAGSIDRQEYDSQDRNLKGISNLVGADWRFSNWLLSGRYDTYTLRGPSRRDTDTNTKSLSLARDRDTAVFGRLSWVQTVDNSFDAKYKTSSLLADASWRIAPRLTFNQKINYSVRTAQEVTGQSDAWALISEIRSNPKPNMFLDLRYSDRWVTEVLGTGFTNFTDAEVTGSWAIFPYLNYAGQAVYQMRDRTDWLFRNSLSWAPLPGGSMVFQFHVRDHQDTRTDYMRRGGGASLTWKARPRLNLYGGVDKFYEKVGSERGYPVSYEFRGYWTF
jgi:hypothetical protein